MVAVDSGNLSVGCCCKIEDTDLKLNGDARFESSVVRLTNDSNQYSIGRAFYPSPLPMLNSSTESTNTSFSTSFVFSVLPQSTSNPGFGVAFFLSNSSSPPNAIAGQYFGLFSNATRPSVYPLIAVEFDTGINVEFNDPDANHVGTLGYLAPELANVVAPTTASDVYSYGVVVLEVVCGRRPIETWSVDEPLLIDWVRELYVEGRLSEAADSRIAGEYKVEDMEAVLKLGLACCHPHPHHRPTMREVVALLLGEEVSAAPQRLLSQLSRALSGGVEVPEPPLPPPGSRGN